MKLGGNVGTKVRLVVLKFHTNRFNDDVIMTSVLRFFLLQRDRILSQREMIIMLSPDCDTSDSDLVNRPSYAIYGSCQN